MDTQIHKLVDDHPSMSNRPTYEELEQRVKALEENTGERRQLEIKLRNSEAKSRAWLENSPVCTKIVDLDFNLQYMSSAGIRSLGIEDIGEFYEKPYPLDFYPESFRSEMTQNLEKARTTGDVVTQEASVVDIEGHELWFHSTLVPVKNEQGRIDYIIVVSIDETERKLAEQAVRESAVPLDDVLASAVDSLSAQIGETRAKVNLPSYMPVIQGSVTLTTHILINVLENAIKYHKPGITPIIDITHETIGDAVVISVADNGIGIEPKYQESIFSIFKRLHSQDEYPGTGIGLASVRKALQIMKGQVHLESALGKGERFQNRDAYRT